MEFAFTHPFAFVIPLLYWLCERRCRRELPQRLLSNIDLLRRSGAGRGARLERWLRWGVLLLLSVALADPVSERSFEIERSEGYEIALLLDASYSMREGERFEKAKRVLDGFIQSRKEDAMALVLFADTPYMSVPMTYDKEGLRRVLEYLKVGIAGGRETALYEALFMSAALFGEEEAKNRIAILLTDGIDTLDKVPLLAALKRMKSRGIRVYTIGIGDDYEKETLQKIAKETGGEFFEAAKEEELLRAYRTIDAKEKLPVERRNVTSVRHWYRYPLGVAALLLVLLLANNLRRRREAARLLATLALVAVAFYGPQLAKRGVKQKAPEGELLVAFDISRYTQVRDLYPDRLSFALHRIVVLLKSLEGVRVGLMGFAKIPYLLSPPTADHEALKKLLERMELESVDRSGSDVAAALRGAASLLKGAKEPGIVLLMTPGAGDFTRAQNIAEEERIALVTYGLGTSSGGAVEEDGKTAKDEKGRVIVSRIDPRLEELAKRSGGEYIAASIDDSQMEELARRIRERLSEKGLEGMEEDLGVELFGLPLGLAIVLFAFPLSMLRKRKKR